MPPQSSTSDTGGNSSSIHGRSFTYLPEWQVLLCVSCGSCLPPTCSAQTRHLREPPHRLRGAELSHLIELFASYQLRPLPVPIERDGISPATLQLPLPTKAVAGLRLRAGFACLLCSTFLSCDRKALQRHISKQHGQKRTVEQIEGASYQRCTLQTFFAETKHIKYFLVSDCGESTNSHDLSNGALLASEKAFLEATLIEQNEATRAASASANIMAAFDMHKSEVIPWLRTTGIAEHLQGLRKDEIAAAIALPTRAEQEKEPVLSLLLDIFERVLRDAHSWCFQGPQQRLTWPRQLALNCFYNESSTTSRRRLCGFDPHKEAATLTTYFRYWKQFLCYHYRVVYRGEHFTEVEGVLQTPEKGICINPSQQQLWDDVVRALEAKEPDLDSLKLLVQRLSLSMLQVKHGTQRFSSSLVSFCAMLSVKPSTLAWKDAGNFNSFLSGLIWTTQLLIFHHCATEEMAGKGEGLDLIRNYCKRFLAQGTETPMGEVLRWRLLLFRVAKETVGLRQATWDEAEEVLTYGGVELRMDEVPRLLLSEFREAQCYLYDELMLNAATALPRIHAWALKDDFDNATVGWFFGRHRLNEALLAPQRKALLQQLFASPSLRDTFLDRSGKAGTSEDSSAREGTILAGAREASGAVQWRTKALVQYEAVVYEFLKRLIVLIHVTAGQPLREPELLSLTWFNTQKRRAITIKHDRVMLHTTYHKGQQQTGTFKDNIRFLPAAVGELLLEYLVYIVPLREIFLCHLTPKTAMKPFLWWKQGKIWSDGSLSEAMRQASMRAKIPCLKIANWRQMTVSIVKTKFAADLRYFDAVGSGCGVDTEDDEEEAEEDIRLMTRQRNHSTRTVNRAYANAMSGSFGNVWDGLVRQNLRASFLWQGLWGVAELLTPLRKRRVGENNGYDGEEKEDRGLGTERATMGTKRPRLLAQVARGIYRRRPQWTTAEILKGARRLFQDEAFQWKSPEQEHAVVVVMSGAEQVIAVLPTGAGKSLLFLVPCILPGARVTVVIVPLVSLRSDLIRRISKLGLEHLVWTEGEQRCPPLVLVTTEAACTQAFLVYAQRMVAMQSLDRIVIDECHLTLTAADYRESMVNVAHIRQLRTQFVYLTATLPPSMHEAFERQNFLHRPKVVRASSNRPNLHYIVDTAAGNEPFLQEAATEAREGWKFIMTNSEWPLDEERRRSAKILVYVQRRAEAKELASILRCSAYTACSGTEEDKAAIIKQWLTSAVPYLVATAALSAGFDYPHIRMVLHAGEPSSLIDFAQESGRAGRDGHIAHAAVLLPSTWQPGIAESFITPEQAALNRYLGCGDCFRACLSATLDVPAQQVQSCEGRNVECNVCRQRSRTLEGGSNGRQLSSSPDLQVEEEVLVPTHTGSQLIQDQRYIEYRELCRYKEDLRVVKGTCLLCRAYEEAWDHPFCECHRRSDLIHVQDKVQLSRAGWIPAYHACFWCYNPQSVCGRPDPKRGLSACEYPDIVLPLCFAVYTKGRGAAWLKRQARREFRDEVDFIRWCGTRTTFGGGKAIWGVRLAAAALLELDVF